MTRDEKIAEAQRLVGRGLTRREAAEVLGVTSSCITKWLNPDRAREYARRDNARPERREEKSAWERTDRGRALRRQRKERARAACVDCGELRGPASKWYGERCKACETAARALRHAEVLGRIERMWNEDGMTGAEIAYALGRNTPHSADRDIQTLRAAGRLLPRSAGRRSKIRR